MINLFDNYENYKELSLNHRRFKHKDIQPLIAALPFEKEIIGHSFEKREITKIKIGKGSKTILLWSQMHGNEATATMALFDIFKFFQAKNDGFDDFREEILKACTLHFIPMLNPDGAERFIRSTAQDIDMNRDALALQCPESQLLKNMVLGLKPEFSFNLHDQDIRYAAGFNDKQATISFLATAYNHEREWNAGRISSRQVINHMNEILQTFIPNGVGKFSDEFEPRAFGDNIQKWGSSLILIESGGYQNDVEKQFIRKLNFVAILSALQSISQESYTKYTLEDYIAIPENQKLFFDLKIENLQIKTDFGHYFVDMGINREEKNNADASDFQNNGVIEDVGDLSVFYGINNFDAKQGVLKSLAEYPEIAKKYNIDSINLPKVGEKADFVIDHGNEITVVINGEIV